MCIITTHNPRLILQCFCSLLFLYRIWLHLRTPCGDWLKRSQANWTPCQLNKAVERRLWQPFCRVSVPVVSQFHNWIWRKFFLKQSFFKVGCSFNRISICWMERGVFFCPFYRCINSCMDACYSYNAWLLRRVNATVVRLQIPACLLVPYRSLFANCVALPIKIDSL